MVRNGAGVAVVTGVGDAVGTGDGVGVTVFETYPVGSAWLPGRSVSWGETVSRKYSAPWSSSVAASSAIPDSPRKTA